MDLLLDYDPSSNVGNWIYIAGVGNDPRPIRKFNTLKQAETYDRKNQYRNRGGENGIASSFWMILILVELFAMTADYTNPKVTRRGSIMQTLRLLFLFQ